MSTYSEQLVARTAEFEFATIPEEVVIAAKLHALDVLGCGLAAQGIGAAAYVSAASAEVATAGVASAIGQPDGLPPAEAALINGTKCHALDYDDTHPDSVVHVSACVVPAALAAGQAAGSTGAELITAIVAGNETSTRLGAAAGGAFHARGLHPTGVCGVFGATVAAARLRGLSPAATVNALGIAGSMSSGLLEFLADGAETKQLHPGWAAHAALTATRLAAHGATGPPTVFEGERGFFAAYLHGIAPDFDGLVSDLGQRWETLAIAFKPYPACHYTHAPIDALAQLVRAEDLRAADVASITAFSDETGVALVLDPLEDKLRPRTAYDAKFSLPFCLATFLVHGEVGVQSFTAEAIADPDVLAIAATVDYELRQYSPSPDAFGGGVLVRTHDGRSFEAELRYQRGGAENPMTAADIRGKYRSNAGLGLGADAVDALENAVMGIEHEADLSGFAVLGAAAAKLAEPVA